MPRTYSLAVSLAVLLASGSVRADAPPASERPLAPGGMESAELKGGEAHRYAITLATGQYAKVVAVQHGIDVIVSSHAPSGDKLAEVDSPNGTDGPEPIGIVAKEAGTYIVEVRSPDGSVPAGRYDIRVETLLTAEEYAKWGIVPVPPSAPIACAGAYEIAPGHVLAVGPLDELGMRLVATDTRTGRVAALNAHSETEYFSGPTLLSEYPVATFYRFRRDAAGAIDGVSIEERDAAPVFAKRIGPARSEEIAFEHDGLRLTGVLHLPAGKGPFPTLVYAHGSGPATRFVGHYPQFFASLGFAVFAFDKRGTGQSQGDWRTASFDSLAGDIQAGIDVLKTRREVDASRIGIFGISQGGWVGSLVTSRSKDVRFFLAIVGSGVPVWENVAHETASDMRDAGLTGAVLDEGHAFARKVFSMVADGATPEAVRAAALAAKGKPWVNAVWMTQVPPDSPWWTWWARNGRVDPAEILPGIRVPVLWILGERDSQVPTAQSEPRIRAAFEKGGNRRVTVKVMPNAGHPLFECDTCLRSELPRLTRFAPGYLDLLATWLTEQAKTPPP